MPTDTTSNSTPAAAKTQEEVYKVGVRIPPFWPEEPAVWFAQVEGQFILSGITADSTKFYYVTAHLEHQYAAEVKDIIANPPAENKYNKLKTELIKRLSASQEKKVRQLLTHEELGDRKPSQFLRHLQTLAGPSVPDDFIRTLWAGRLPTNIQTVIASQHKLPLTEVAELADTIYDIVPCTTQVASTSTASDNRSMAAQIAELSQQVASLQSQLRHERSRPRSRDRFGDRKGNYRSRSRSKSFDPSVCWYHRRFKDHAKRCTQPCSYSSSSAGNATGSRK